MTSHSPHDVLQRLHASTLYNGLKEIGASASVALLDSGPEKITAPTHVVVNYHDGPAIAVAMELRKQRAVKLICLCADVYDLGRYRHLSDAIDLFLAPTPLHRQAIQSAVIKPVLVLPEAVDPIALPGQGPEVPVSCNERLCWFGYPESFAKSMRYLLGDAFALASFDSARLTLITGGGEALWPGAAQVAFSESGFYRDVAGFGYALLSHFAYDLHLNSFIKSPNRMMTALVRGLVPLVSATPAYHHLARQYGLEPLLFDGPVTLSRQLKALDCARDRARFGLDAIRVDLLKNHSPASTARRFLTLVS